MSTIVVGASWVVGSNTIQAAIFSDFLLRFTPLADELVEHGPCCDTFVGLEEDSNFAELQGWFGLEKKHVCDDYFRCQRIFLT